MKKAKTSPLTNVEPAGESYQLKFEPEEVSFDMNVTLRKPFGPCIMNAQLPVPIYKEMVKVTDEILADKKRVNWGPNLAGQIKEEPHISNELLLERDLFGFFNILTQRYIQEANALHGSSGLHEIERRNPEKNIVLNTNITSMWIVSQYENEYNPIHHHTNSTISAVMYLNVPKYKKRDIYGKKDLDGNIEFVYHAAAEDHFSMEQGAFSVQPKEGDIFMFPSYLLHTVYPFLGDGERRSVSFNVLHTYQPDSEIVEQEESSKKKKTRGKNK